MKQLKPVLGENLEDLSCELECGRCAQKLALLNSVLGENIEDLHHSPDDHEELGMSMLCSAVCCCREEKDTTVGTSTSCSTVCGAFSTLRERRDDDEILGTAITCS